MADPILRNHLLKLAREGRIVETAFDTFHKAAFAGAGPDQINLMRICFFAGAAELHTVMLTALDAGDDVSGSDMAFTASWVREIESFHERTIAAATAGGAGRG